jgi:hypothetical protein
MRLVLFCAASPFFLAGCVSTPVHSAEAMPFRENSDAMRLEILKRVPYGMPIKQARSTMEANGFSCQVVAKARVMLCDAVHSFKPSETTHVRVWLYYDPEDVVKEAFVRCEPD